MAVTRACGEEETIAQRKTREVSTAGATLRLSSHVAGVLKSKDKDGFPLPLVHIKSNIGQWEP